MKLKERKINKSQLIKIGSFIIIILSFIFIGFSLYKDYKVEENNENELKEFYEVQEEIIISNKGEQEEIIEKVINTESYIGVLKIGKINLERGFYSKESKLNNVNKNIQIINSSDLPDKENGNVILAAHCGNSRVAFFNKLPNLELGDIATIYYQGREYSYQLVDNYEIEKSGQASIKRNRDKNVLTLITCKHKTNKQLIFIFELINIE